MSCHSVLANFKEIHPSNWHAMAHEVPAPHCPPDRASIDAPTRASHRPFVSADPAWKKLVDDLRARGHESPYLDRLRERLPVGGAVADLQREILQEMASALGRAEDKVNVALLELEVEGKALDAMAPTDPSRPKSIARFDELRERALRALWELRVHREALGLRRHDKLAELLPRALEAALIRSFARAPRGRTRARRSTPARRSTRRAARSR
jgi:hypothetical protein